MDKDTRNAIDRATQKARRLLEADFAHQLEGDFAILESGEVDAKAPKHLRPRQVFARDKIIAAIEHKRAAGLAPAKAVGDYLRDAAFTTLNRFVALFMLEARGLVQTCVSKGEQSSGYTEYCGMAPGVKLLPDGQGYRLYLESIFDELSTEVKVLFDRRDPASVLWPKRPTLETLLELWAAPELASVWNEDETIGWVYQYFNGSDERRKMREESQAPRNSHELAVRNQFFTPRYVVQFLTDNTLGRIWYEMRGGDTVLRDRCEYLVRRPDETWAPRTKKDPRDLKVLDPACGSGHFLLYAFDVLVPIYEEAWADAESPPSAATGRRLSVDHGTLESLRKAMPALILAHNLHGVDIDARCAQIAQLALWMRAQRAYKDAEVPRAERPVIRRSNIVIAEPLVAEAAMVDDFVKALGDAALGELFRKLLDTLRLAGELGLLLRLEKLVEQGPAKGQTGDLFAPPEERIRTTLAKYVTETDAAGSTRRRLFIEDTSQGMSLLELAEKKYDTVLMNPPFGLPIETKAVSFTVDVPDNCYSWFMLRAGEVLSPDGLCGAITDSTWLKQPTFAALRRQLLTGTSLTILVDLGWGVLDANVRTLMCVFRGKQGDSFQIADWSDEAMRPRRINIDGLSIRNTLATLALPKSILSPGFGPDEALELSRFPTLDSQAELPWGCGANDSFRLFRLRWEITSDDTNWTPMTNGGSYSPFYRENYLVCRTAFGSVCAFDVQDKDGEKLWDASARHLIAKAGLTYPKRSELFHVSRLEAGHVVTPEGKGLFPHSLDLDAACGLANSSLVGLMASFLCGPHKQRGDVALLPFPALDAQQLAEVRSAASIAAAAIQSVYRTRETSILFALPTGLETAVAAARRVVIEQRQRIDAALAPDVPARMQMLVAEYSRVVDEQVEAAWVSDVDEVFAWRSFAVGVLFGRFNVPVRTGLEPLPPRPTWVDDPGHPADIADAVARVLSYCDQSPPEGLRNWIAAEFFPLHIKMYSKSRRKAPIYWQLATPSGSYSIWLYIHAFTKNTLFDVVDLIDTKVRHQERVRDRLVRESEGDAPESARREAVVAGEFLDELRGMLEEAQRVKALWNPDPDDGVIINFAPLWRLVPHHKPWQKELRATWDALCAGTYDWSHLAMHLWPERVVPKCATDRSFAIAHGLEEVFWFEDRNGKWKPRPAPTHPVAELVAERTSAAVIEARDSLIAASSTDVSKASKRTRKKAAPRLVRRRR